jgi:hypothetical protein
LSFILLQPLDYHADVALGMLIDRLSVLTVFTVMVFVALAVDFQWSLSETDARWTLFCFCYHSSQLHHQTHTNAALTPSMKPNAISVIATHPPLAAEELWASGVIVANVHHPYHNAKGIQYTLMLSLYTQSDDIQCLFFHLQRYNDDHGCTVASFPILLGPYLRAWLVAK